MPAGDPAGYLPNVIKKRLKKEGATPYKSRKRQGTMRKLKPAIPSRPKAGPGTGGVEAPAPMPKRVGGKRKKLPYMGRAPKRGFRRSGF